MEPGESVNEGSAHLRRTRKWLCLFQRLSEGQAGESLPGPESLQHLLECPESLGLEASKKLSQALPDLSHLGSSLGECQRQGKPNLVGEATGSPGRKDSPQVSGRERSPKCILEDLVRFPEGRPADQGVSIRIQTGPGQASPTHDDPNRCAFVEIQVTADVPESDTEEDGPRERAIPRPEKDPESEVEAVGNQ